MNPFEVLKQDYAAIRSVLEKLRILPENERVQRRDAFHQLETHLELHFDLKRNFFYPVMHGQQETSSCVKDLQVEENAIRQFTVQMRGTSSPRFFNSLLQ